MSSRICLDMYLLSLILIGAVALGFGIHEIVTMQSEHTCQPCHDQRARHINSMVVP
jgi:hypothetical protein